MKDPNDPYLFSYFHLSHNVVLEYIRAVMESIQNTFIQNSILNTFFEYSEVNTF